MVHSPYVFFYGFLNQSLQLIINRLAGTGILHNAAMIFFNHADGSVQQVAKVICKVSVYAGNQSITREVAVAAKVDFAQQEVADSVSAELVNQAQRVDNIALGFGHFIAVDYEPAMAVNLLRHLEAHSVQHNRPDNRMEAHDFLAYEVQACRPVFMEERIIYAVFDTGQIVQQSVEPYINNVLLVEGNRNAPVEGGTRNAQVLKALLNEVNHLVTTACRLDEIRMLFDELQPPVLIFAHFEEIAFLLHLFNGTMAVRAAAVLVELTLQPVGFARNAVQALVVFLIDIALLINFLQRVLNYLVMALLTGADEVIVGDIQTLPEQLKVSDNSVNILNRSYALFLCLTLDFQTMLVTAGQKENVLALQTMEACQAVGNRRAISMTDMQIITRIIDWCGNIITRFSHCLSLLLRKLVGYIAPFWGFYVFLRPVPAQTFYLRPQP